MIISTYSIFMCLYADHKSVYRLKISLRGLQAISMQNQFYVQWLNTSRFLVPIQLCLRKLNREYFHLYILHITLASHVSFYFSMYLFSNLKSFISVFLCYLLALNFELRFIWWWNTEEMNMHHKMHLSICLNFFSTFIVQEIFEDFFRCCCYSTTHRSRSLISISSNSIVCDQFDTSAFSLNKLNPILPMLKNFENIYVHKK
jgi:hypothetical protein